MAASFSLKPEVPRTTTSSRVMLSSLSSGTTCRAVWRYCRSPCRRRRFPRPRAYCILGGDRDAEGRGGWVTSSESGVGQGDVNTVIVDSDEHVTFEGDDAALLEAERPKLDANPDDVRAGGLSDFDDAERRDTSPVHAHRVQATANAVGETVIPARGWLPSTLGSLRQSRLRGHLDLRRGRVWW
jgi:hypothetical protein